MVKADDSERIEPRASSLIPLLRSVGYSLSTAVADIIDNSIAATSRNVWVRAEWDGESSFFSITDDGCGIHNPHSRRLCDGAAEAHRNRGPRVIWADSGSVSKPHLSRSVDGLQSFPKRGRLTWPVRCRDLDYINSCHDWMLLRSVDRNTMSLLKCSDSSSGTVVLWQRLDRVVPSGTRGDNKKAQARFLQQLEEVKKHLAMVFHRFLEQGTLKIWFNGNVVEPWNPFLVSHGGNPAASGRKIWRQGVSGLCEAERTPTRFKTL